MLDQHKRDSKQYGQGKKWGRGALGESWEEG